MLGGVTAPMRKVPLVTPCSAASSSPACSSNRRMRSENVAITSPAAVSWMLRPTLRVSAMPAMSSSVRSCSETAGCVTCIASAARDTLSWRATNTSDCSWRKLA